MKALEESLAKWRLTFPKYIDLPDDDDDDDQPCACAGGGYTSPCSCHPEN